MSGGRNRCCFSRALCFYNLFHMGSFSRRALFFRPLPVPLLFTGNFRRLPKAGLVRSRLGGRQRFCLVARTTHTLGSGRISVDLLLLSRRILQSVLGRPTFVQRRRATKILLGRTLLSLNHAKYTPLFPLDCTALSPFGAHDVWKAMWFTDAATGEVPWDRSRNSGVSCQVFLLSGYTLGCHSLRHLVGGFMDQT